MSGTSSIKPLAISMGEPAGVGPELVARLWTERKELKLPSFIYVGSPEPIKATHPDLPVTVIDDPSSAATLFEKTLPCLEVSCPHNIILGVGDAGNGLAVVEAIDRATSLVQNGDASALVTAPINKELLYSAGFTAPGHTEYLARLAGLKDNASVMMLATDELRVVPVTVHIALKDVAQTLTADKVIHAGLVVHHDLRQRFGIEKPRIAVAGLNPHAGEGGAMGMEEATHIKPAIWALQDDGVNVTGPLPADTLFHADARKNYDAVLCMYHDQALIPLKTLDFWGGVNVTLGLPFIRTSPDHGTALPLAGTGKARTDSMLSAIRMAADMAYRQIS